MANLGNEQPQNIEFPSANNHKKGIKTRYLVVLAIFLFVLASLWTRHIMFGKDSGGYENTLKPKSVGFIQTVKNFIFNSGDILLGQNDDRINILLLGMGGAGHDGPYLTDTNIILSIKPSTNEVAMVSIPRDLGAEIPGRGTRKINEANSVGEVSKPGEGGEYARAIFEKTFNLDIPYYIRLDFKAFTEIIDTVGGVSIDVPRTFTDTAYPGEGTSYITVHYDAGVQTMNGEQALIFSRSRHGDNGEGSDFARSHRQQLVLTALKEKILSFGTYTNPLTVQKMLASLSNHITTNLNIGQIMYLASMAKEAKTPMSTLVLDNSENGFLLSTTGENGAFLLSPKTGNFDTINTSIKNIFEDKGKLAIIPTVATVGTVKTVVATTSAKISSLFPNIKIEVQNGTWKVGMAARIKQNLEEKGYSINSIGNSLKRPIDKTAIYILHESIDNQIVKKLSQELSAPMYTVLPDWLKPEYNNPNTMEDEGGMKYNSESDILIILGNDIKE